ncbi:MAG: hypothetical protein LBV33_00595 [Lachnospiraceae bacterium]|jgi:hypothetical protein|nr:hypothetical protein [Lachnospiraceae bacterium]
MRDSDIKAQINQKRAEMNKLLEKGDFASYMQISKEVDKIWRVVLNKDCGLRYLYTFIAIWRNEKVLGERTILEGIKNVDELVEKCRVIRHAMRRLENDFPDELCLEAISNIADMQLSKTAFQFLLPSVVEDEQKVMRRISEINELYQG